MQNADDQRSPLPRIRPKAVGRFGLIGGHQKISLQFLCTYVKINIQQNQSKGETNMAYLINSDCINCGICEAECPVECISAGDGVYVIDEAACIDCEACVPVCPVSAIVKA